METKHYLFLGLSTAFFGLFFIYPSFKKNKLIGESHEIKQQSAQDYCHNWLEEYEKNIWALLTHYNISHLQYENYRKMSEDEYNKSLQLFNQTQQNGPSLSKKTLELIHKVCDDFHIDKNQLSLFSYVSRHPSPAFAHDKALFIHEESFNKISYKAQLFVIGHELSHIIFKDDSFRWVLKNIVPNNKSLNDPHHPVNIINRLQEIRADIHAMSQSDEYAQGFEEFLNGALKLHGPGKAITHPTLPDRLNAGKPLLALYEAKQSHNKSIIL